MQPEKNPPVWGIDLGGTKIEGVVLRSAQSCDVLSRIRIATEGERGYCHVVDRIVGLVERMAEDVGFLPSSLGIGTPGSVDPQNDTLKGSNSTHLNGQPLHRDLGERLGVPVFIENDANCFALAETHLGAVAERFPEAGCVFGVIMGTGVGGGFVIDGKLVRGRHGIAGEWGHNFLHESGGPCYCGRTGCVETILSGHALEKFYRSLSGHKKNLAEIAAQVEGDACAQKTVNRLHRYLSLALSQVINIIDPDVVVIGGGVGNIDSLYSTGLKILEESVFNPYVNTHVVPPKLGDSAGVFGAALLTTW
ncbi:MAG: ROK family protein [Pseudomonadota bacterium]